jgi:hypothetical protein
LGLHCGGACGGAKSHARGRHMWAPCATIPGPDQGYCARPARASAARPRPKPTPRPGEPRRPWGAQVCPPSRTPPPAATPARRGEPAMATVYSPTSLSRKAFYTLMHAPTINSHPRRSPRARKLRRMPLAPPRANSATIRSSHRSTPRASPLGLA